MIIAILTDGEENASERYSMADINQRITHQTAKYSWEFLFLGANQDAIATAAHLGIQAHQAATQDVSFIDAAHLIPFAESHNDHPTNGLVLCKNHHWAMDRNLIAPAPDHHWHVSKVLDPRRSNGEAELLALAGKTLLLPQDQAFHPGADGLQWRFSQLVA